MSLRPPARKTETVDLESARRAVSRAEREALEKAEQLRDEADRLLRAASNRKVDAEGQVSQEYQHELDALRAEMEVLSRRATKAEAEAQIVRSENAALTERLKAAGSDSKLPSGAAGPASVAAEVTPLRLIDTDLPPGLTAESDDIDGPLILQTLMDRMSGDAERLMTAASTAATRLHSQAELDLARAREEAVEVLASATKEAEDLLAAAVAAIERDTAIASATREQAERDGETAASIRRELESARDAAEADAEAIRDLARKEADAIRASADEDAARAVERMKAGLSDEVKILRIALEQTRTALDHFLDGHRDQQPGPPASAADPASPPQPR